MHQAAIAVSVRLFEIETRKEHTSKPYMVVPMVFVYWLFVVAMLLLLLVLLSSVLMLLLMLLLLVVGFQCVLLAV
jgi:hypothetical protein